MPAEVRSRIMARSNSANEPTICIIMRPAGVVVSKPPAISDDGYVTMGGPDEATYYVTECGPAWHRTPGAVAWLTKLAATLPAKKRTRATMH
jgi:hypothetical protein